MEYTLKDGTVVPLKRVATRHIQRIRSKFTKPDTPTYSFEAAGGVTVTRTHDKTTLETAEDHKTWNEYEVEFYRIQAAEQLEIAHFLVYHCIDMDAPPVEEWSVDFDLWDFEVPDPSDKIAYKVEWFESELAADPEDSAGLMGQLYRMGGILEEGQVAKFEAFFRATVERLTIAALHRASR